MRGSQEYKTAAEKTWEGHVTTVQIGLPLLQKSWYERRLTSILREQERLAEMRISRCSAQDGQDSSSENIAGGGMATATVMGRAGLNCNVWLTLKELTFEHQFSFSDKSGEMGSIAYHRRYFVAPW